MRLLKSTFAVAGLVAGLSLPASADMLQIQLGGFDITYESTPVAAGGVIRSVDGQPDPLSSADFFEAFDLKLGLSPMAGDALDALLVTTTQQDFLVTGNTVDLFPGAVALTPEDSLQLRLGESGETPSDFGIRIVSGTATFIPDTLPSFPMVVPGFQIVAEGSINDSVTLPYGSVAAGTPVSILLQGQIFDPVQTDGNEVTGFRVAGNATLVVIPEPASLLFAAAGLGLLIRRRRAC